MKVTVPSILLVGLFFVSIFSSSESSKSDTTQMVMASSIRNATFIERTPDFTDLYLIQTPDKGRRIVIYCNSVFCYKQRNQTLTT